MKKPVLLHEDFYMNPKIKKYLKLLMIGTAIPVIPSIIYISYLIIHYDLKIDSWHNLKTNFQIYQLSRKIEKNPRDYQAYIDLSSLFCELGKRDNTLQDLKKAIEIDPKNPDEFLERSDFFKTQSYLCKSNEKVIYLKKAIDDMSKAIELTNNNVFQYYMYRSYLFDMLEEYNNEIADIGKAIELAPSSMKYHCYMWRVFTYLNRKDFDNAIVDLDRCFNIKPDSYTFGIFAQAYLQKAFYFEDKGKIHEALQAYDKYLKFVKGNKVYASENSETIKGVGKRISALHKI
jgi:tetratricopeptide (TPR) repeat protein